eukprot:gene6525-8114_t
MLTGIHGIDRMIASSDEMVAVGAVDNLIKDARAERLQFLANGDMQHAKNIEELVDRMLKQNEQMRPQFAEGEGARRLEGLNAAVLAYRQSLGDLIRAQETRNAARAVLVKSAESSLQVFEKLQNQLFDELAPPGARLHFVSVEKYPLAREDLARAIAAFKALLARPWLMALLGLPVVLVLVGAIVAIFLWQQLPALDVLTDYQPHQPLRVMSADGQLLGEFGAERRRFVALKDTPKA